MERVLSSPQAFEFIVNSQLVGARARGAANSPAICQHSRVDAAKALKINR
jgi:hypothetical protein